MRQNNRLTGFVLNFFLGVAWACVLIGITLSFLSYSGQGIVLAILASFIGALPGLLVVLILEHIVTTKEQLEELQKQIKFLQKLMMDKEQEETEE